MIKRPKNIAKSIRISEYTLAMIEDMRGEGFNEKLSMLVYDYAQHCRDIQNRIETLEAEEQRLIKRIDTLHKQANRTLPDISRYLDNIRVIIKNAPIEGQTSL